MSERKYPELLKSTELAERLNVGRQTIHDWMNKGLIKPAIREGRVIRFDYEAVLEALKPKDT